jgi:hypothetical protein
MAQYDALQQNLIKHGQDHVLKHWADLNDDEKAAFAADLETIDFETMDKQFKSAMAGMCTAKGLKGRDSLWICYKSLALTLQETLVANWTSS